MTMNAIQIAAKFYEARDTVKALWPQDWRERIAPYRLIASGLLWPATAGAAEPMIFFIPSKNPCETQRSKCNPVSDK